MRTRYNKFYLVVIADYNDDDAHGIVQDNLYYWFDQNDLTIMNYDRVDVAPFNTVETGYMLARRALNPLSPSRRQVFFVNTAPRMDDLTERKTNQGEGFVHAELTNGKQIFAVNSGHTLSFVKPEIKHLHHLNVPDSTNDIPLLVEAFRSANPGAADANPGAGQFRSGYIYPILVARALAGSTEPISPANSSLFGPELDVDVIPDIPQNRIVFKDGYGNFKSSIEPQELEQHFDEHAVVTCDGREIIAHIKTAIFDVPLYHFSFAPGSTILAYSDGTRRQFVEVVQRGGHCANAFTHAIGDGRYTYPVTGDEIHWRLAEPGDFSRLGFSTAGGPPKRLLQWTSRCQ
ncbi:MAG: hypothetical protein V3V97_12955 [Hyphomicrobiaceae bacterium]